MKCFFVRIAIFSLLKIGMYDCDKWFELILSNLTTTLKKNCQEINFINFNSECEIFNRFVKKSEIPVIVKDETKKTSSRVNNSAILNFDSIDTLKNFNKNVKLTNQFPKKFRF